MPKITQIQQDNKTRRVLVYIDYRFCASIRENVWDAMELKLGDEITCVKLHQKEKNVYAKLRKHNSNYSNKQAINRVAGWFNKYVKALDVRIVDFKYDSNVDSSAYYPKTRYDKNINLLIKDSNTPILTLEVASIEIQRGDHYWINMDKITYAQQQTEIDSWVVLHHKYPVEKFIWIKPEPKKIYAAETLIKNSKQQFVFFKQDSPEVYSSTKFFAYLQAKLAGKEIREVDGVLRKN